MANPPIPKTPPQVDEGSFFPTLQKEMNRLLEQFRTGFPLSETASSAVFGPPAFPALDIVERDDAVEISAEVPGVKEEDLDVSITGQMLTIKGQKGSEHEEEKDNFHRIERRYGSFRRSVPLGFTPDDGAVSADFSDGVLKLTIRKPEDEASGVQKIDIKKR